MGGGDIVPAVLERGTDTVATLAYGSVGQTDGVKVVFIGFNAGNVDFDFDNASVNAVNGGSESFIEQKTHPWWGSGWRRLERSRGWGRG